VRRVAVGRTLLIAGVCALVPLIGNVVASFVTAWTGGGTWLVVPVVGVGVAMVTALIQAYGSAGSTAPAPSPLHPGPGLPPDVDDYRRYGPPEQRGTPLAVALVIGLLVLGVGGFAVTQAVRFAVSYVTGNESGPDRLVGPATGSAHGLTLTVENVWHTRHFTRVRVATSNGSDMSLSLPLYGNCVFIGEDGTSLQPDPFRSNWPDQLVPSALQRGTITFKGHIPDPVRTAGLSFGHVFGTFGGGSISVRNIKLRPP
jgi:hypothetical protein